MGAGSIAVLTYHVIDDVKGFTRHLTWLRHDASPVCLTAAVEMLGGAPAPERAVLVTLDDGDRSVIDIAAPLMADLGIPGVAFVIARLIDTDDPCWWTEVRELTHGEAEPILTALKSTSNDVRVEFIRRLRERSGTRVVQQQLRANELGILEDCGLDIGCHSSTHPCLDRCDDAEIDVEVAGARRMLGELVGHEPIAYAYPNGNHDARSRAAVEAAGFSVAFGYDGRRALTPTNGMYTVSRIRINPWEPVARLARIVCSGSASTSVTP